MKITTGVVKAYLDYDPRMTRRLIRNRTIPAYKRGGFYIIEARWFCHQLRWEYGKTEAEAIMERISFVYEQINDYLRGR